MEYRSVLSFSARDAPYTVIVEPWAEEYEVSRDQLCQLVALHPSAAPSFDVEMYREALIVSVQEGGATYEFWRGDVLEFKTDIAIPTWPPEP